MLRDDICAKCLIYITFSFLNFDTEITFVLMFMKRPGNSCITCKSGKDIIYDKQLVFTTIHLGHVENSDDTEQAYKLEHQVEILQWVALRGGSSDLWW
jgi:hypothetical protein